MSHEIPGPDATDKLPQSLDHEGDLTFERTDKPFLEVLAHMQNVDQKSITMALAPKLLNRQQIQNIRGGIPEIETQLRSIIDSIALAIPDPSEYINENNPTPETFYSAAKDALEYILSINDGSDITSKLSLYLDFQEYIRAINHPADLRNLTIPDRKQRAIDTFCDIFQADVGQVQVIGTGGAGLGKIAITHRKLPQWVFRFYQNPLEAANLSLNKLSEQHAALRVNNDMLCARILALPGTSFDICERVIPLNKITQKAHEIAPAHAEEFKDLLNQLMEAHPMVGKVPLFEARDRNLGIVNRDGKLVVVAYDIGDLHDNIDLSQNAGRLIDPVPSMIPDDSNLYQFVQNNFLLT